MAGLRKKAQMALTDQSVKRQKIIYHDPRKFDTRAEHKPEDRQEQIDRLIRAYGLQNNGHSLFSPSSSAGWLNCEGYLLANAGKADVAGEDAAYGTVAHGIAAEWLTAIRDQGKKKAEFVLLPYLGAETVENGFTIKCDTNMVHHLRRYIDWCEEVELEGDVFIEQHVDYSSYTPIPNQGGTADHFVCVSPVLDEAGNMICGGRLIITDLKMGMGIRVFVERNSQAMLYALGVYLEWNWLYSFDRITIRICQPRLDYFGVWECTVEELLVFAEEVRIAADKAWVPDAPRSPSQKACQWCADKTCPAKSRLLEDIADDSFEADDDDEPPAYSAKQLADHVKLGAGPEPRYSPKMPTRLMAWRLKQWPLIKKAFKEWNDELLRRALAGEDIPWFKPGTGRRSFQWYDADYAAEQLSHAGVPEEKIFVTEVTSPSKAVDLLREVGMRPKDARTFLYDSDPDDPDKLPLVRESPGRTKLVPSDDLRQDVRDAADDAFDAEDDDNF